MMYCLRWRNPEKNCTREQ